MADEHNDAERAYDVVVFGATGFTGNLVAEYLAKHVGEAVRWAIAGRNPERLEEIKEYVATLNPACAEIGILQADKNDWASLVLMANKARVVLSTAGPFMDSGDKLVRACVSAGTDYVDITGEPDFVRAMRTEYDQAARDKGLRIVHCCGFDSIPADLGVLYTVERLPEDEPMELSGFVRFQGKMSGGTWQTLVKAMAGVRKGKQGGTEAPEPAARAADGRRVQPSKPRFGRDRKLGVWVYPMPTIDASIVRHSARALARYGPDFRYAHHAVSDSLPRLVATAAGMTAILGLAQLGPTRARLLEYRKPGEGPSAEERARSYFEVTIVGKSPSKQVTTRVSGGDPGYTETAKMVAQSALCLAQDRDRLPERAGVLTPAVAMGDVLIERLQQAGIRFEVLEES